MNGCVVMCYKCQLEFNWSLEFRLMVVEYCTGLGLLAILDLTGIHRAQERYSLSSSAQRESAVIETAERMRQQSDRANETAE